MPGITPRSPIAFAFAAPFPERVPSLRLPFSPPCPTHGSRAVFGELQRVQTMHSPRGRVGRRKGCRREERDAFWG